MDLVEVVIIGLAARAVVDAWLHKGGIFESWTDWVEAYGHVEITSTTIEGNCSSSYVVYPTPTRVDRFRYRLSQLLLCRICLAYHVGAILLVCHLLSHAYPAWLGFLFYVIQAFAAVGVANFLLTLTKDSRDTAGNISGEDAEVSGQGREGFDGDDTGVSRGVRRAGVERRPE